MAVYQDLNSSVIYQHQFLTVSINSPVRASKTNNPSSPSTHPDVETLKGNIAGLIHQAFVHREQQKFKQNGHTSAPWRYQIIFWDPVHVCM